MSRELIRPMNAPSGAVTKCAPFELGVRMLYTGIVVFFRDPLDASRLAHSLARVLQDFSIYAGKVVSHGAELEIQHGTGTVPFECVDSVLGIEDLERAAREGRGQMLDVRVSGLRRALGTEALLSLKLTRARDGNVLSIGINHVVGDLHSLMLLIHAWSHAYVDEPWSKPTLPPDRDAYLRAHMPNPPEAQALVEIGSWRNLAGLVYAVNKPSKQVTLEFHTDELVALQSALSGDRYITVNDALCAHIHCALRRIAGKTQTTNLCLNVNYRRRVGIPDDVVGNLIGLVAQPVTADDTPKTVAAGLRTKIEQYASKYADYQASMRVFDAHPRLSQRMRILSSVFDPLRGDMMVSSVDRSGTRGISFGTARASMFCPITAVTAKLPPNFMLAYDLGQRPGVAVSFTVEKKLGQHLQSREGMELLKGGLEKLEPGRPSSDAALG